MPDQQTQDLSTYKVSSDGNELSGTTNLVSVVVEKSINRIPFARIVFKDGDAAAADFKNSSNTNFEPGKNLKIEAGFHSQNQVIFEGIIIRQRITLKNGRDSFLVVEARDVAYKMTLERKNKYYIKASDSDVVDTITGLYSISNDIDDTKIQHHQMVQYNCTDWDFAVTRMEMNGMYVWPNNGKLICKKPAINNPADTTAIFGTDVISLDVTLDASHQYDTVSCKAWSSSNQDISSSDNDSAALPDTGDLKSSALVGKVNGSSINYRHSGILTEDELKSWANAQQTKYQLSKTRGTITCKGNLEAAPAATISLKGFGDHYNGNYFISAVRNELKESLWETTIQFGWWPELFTEQFPVNQPAASGIIPSVNGMQIGIVTALSSDPESEFRIQIKLPLMDNDDEGIWARIALLDAGNQRGSFFMPDLHDEVLVGFINDDPRHPVVMGMFNSSAKPAPFTPSDDNYQKGFVTKSKLKITFDDDKKIILIETPAGNSITLDEDQHKIILLDEHSNKIEMSSDGISVESSKDIMLKASGDVKAQGVNIDMKASAMVKAEGNSNATIQSSGNTVVKGTTVSIN